MKSLAVPQYAWICGRKLCTPWRQVCRNEKKVEKRLEERKKVCTFAAR